MFKDRAADYMKHIKDTDGRNILQYLCIYGLYKYMQAFPSLVEQTDYQGNTALHYACRYGYPKAIQELREMKANVNAQNIHGETPLHIACVYQHQECYNAIKLYSLPTQDAVNNMAEFYMLPSLLSREKKRARIETSCNPSLW